MGAVAVAVFAGAIGWIRSDMTSLSGDIHDLRADAKETAIRNEADLKAQSSLVSDKLDSINVSLAQIQVALGRVEQRLDDAPVTSAKAAASPAGESDGPTGNDRSTAPRRHKAY